MAVFERYAPFIQEYIYNNDWDELREIQVAAGDAIFNSDKNLLLLASTASGKTEAAFFPILTLLSEDPPKSIGAIYIGPLKALINDQFGRLEELCREADIPVWHWHGDVNQSHKNKMLKNPSGVLQITPESLEAMLIHKHGDIGRLFGDLRFIVIDEVHSLMRGDRGGQTMCLIDRLCKMSGSNPRRIGLSATIGNPMECARFLSAGSNRGCDIPKINSKSQIVHLSMEHFFIQGKNADEKKDDDIIDADVYSINETSGNDNLNIKQGFESKTDIAPFYADPGIGYIYEMSYGKKCLVFCNSREEAEAVTTSLRAYCECMKKEDRFLIHHGNLSASFRQSAEEEMKDEESFLTTVTTSTLELGIDIGKLERVFQVDAPFTVSAFLQRMGRSGRRGEPMEMCFVFREDEPEARAMLPETIPWKLIQAIAIVQVYMEEKFIEAPRLNRLPFSLLYHQTMSILRTGGEMTAAELAAKVLTMPYFHMISLDDFKILLMHLLKTEHIAKTPNGGIIIGLKGERIVNSYKFYAVFQENVEYSVRCESNELGTIAYPPPLGEKVAIAGRTWVVEDVDYQRKIVYCQLVKGQVPAYFGECPGDIDTKILERMKKVLDEDIIYPYLRKGAVHRLKEGRKNSRNAGLTSSPLVNLGGNMWALFPWLGSYSFLALERFLKIKCAPLLALKGLDSSRPYFMIFTMKATKEYFFEVVCEMARMPLDPLELLYENEVPVFEKYDDFIPASLIRKGFAYGVLGVPEMLEKVKSWKKYANFENALPKN